jgi:hypothetical protein
VGDFPLLGDGQRWQPGSTQFSRGVPVTPNASANTKGSWAQLMSVAQGSVDAAGLLIHLSTNTLNTDYLVDIAIGAAGSEVVIAENLYVSLFSFKQVGTWFLPIPIPAGARVAARCQAGAAGGGVVHAHCQIVGTGFLPSAPLGRVTSYGPDTADSGGVSVDPGASANTKGAWVELAAAMSAPMSLALVAFGQQMNPAPTNAVWLVDIGAGASGSEAPVLRDLALAFQIATNGFWSPLVIGPLPVSIPAGSRLVARAASDNTDATDRLLDVLVYGVD